MPLDPGDRPVTRLDLLIALVLVPLTVLVFHLEAIFPPPHPLGRLTGGYRKYFVLLAFGIVGAAVARRVESWSKRRKERDEQSKAAGRKPPSA